MKKITAKRIKTHRPASMSDYTTDLTTSAIPDYAMAFAFFRVLNGLTPEALWKLHIFLRMSCDNEHTVVAKVHGNGEGLALTLEALRDQAVA